MRADEYLMVLRLLDKPSPWMTSSEKSNRGEQNEEKEVTQRGVAQTPRKDIRVQMQAEADRSLPRIYGRPLFLQHLSDCACFKV